MHMKQYWNLKMNNMNAKHCGVEMEEVSMDVENGILESYWHCIICNTDYSIDIHGVKIIKDDDNEN